MTDEERNDQDAPEEANGADEGATPDAELPTPEEAAGTPSPEEPPSTEEPPVEEGGEEQPPPAEAPPAEEAPAEDAPAEDAPAEEPSGEEQPAEEPSAEEAPAEDPKASGEQSGGKEKKADVAPGADLEPIAIEPEVQLSAEERARLEAEEEERAQAEAAAEADDVPVAAKPAKLAGDQTFRATGKRKSSVARVILSKGDGKIQVNSKSLDEYFPREYLRSVVTQPLAQTGYDGTVDVRVNVNGGGISGQAAAARHGIARALCEVNPELRTTLKKRGMLTRDARVKERRKAGLKKARKRPQFSKR